VAIPTRELAHQVFRDILLLLSPCNCESLVQFVGEGGISQEWTPSPIIVGTAKLLAKVLLTVSQLPPQTSPRGFSVSRTCASIPFEVKYLVLDEVDRLLSLTRKHAPVEEKMGRKRHPRPAIQLLSAIVLKNSNVQVLMEEYLQLFGSIHC
jgi:superfamily II DNA/RNA helicase